MSRPQVFGGTLRAKQQQTEIVQSTSNVQTEKPSTGFLATLSAEQERQQAREQLKQMPLLSPWTSYKAYEPSFTDELNRELAKRVEDIVLDKLTSLQERLEKLQAKRENSGVLPISTLDTLLQSRLVVEAKRKVVPAQIAENHHQQSEDAADVATKREPHESRVRYIMSTRLGALPPTKGILDEYPIPKEVLDALERHRHFHVDESSPLTAFEPIRLPPPAPTELNDNTQPRNAAANAEWECFYRRSVPLERSPVSFVLASLAIAPEKPLPAPSDLFHQQKLVAAASDETILLHENFIGTLISSTSWIYLFAVPSPQQATLSTTKMPAKNQAVETSNRAFRFRLIYADNA
ncbi:hypothetical protein ON010_g6746 [Phytophthora cinnamomi]|nr:hypothetical protein ON010_g6746 [Phytophthora cinnamomi]